MNSIGGKGGKQITSANITPNKDGTYTVHRKHDEFVYVSEGNFESIEKAHAYCKKQGYTFIFVENKKRD